MPIAIPACFPELPQFIPAYSAEAWKELENWSDHDTVLVIDLNWNERLFGSAMAVLLMADGTTGAKSVIDLAVANSDQDAVENLLANVY